MLDFKKFALSTPGGVYIRMPRPVTKPKGLHRVAVDISPELHEKFKIKVIREKTTMMEVLQKFVEVYAK